MYLMLTRMLKTNTFYPIIILVNKFSLKATIFHNQNKSFQIFSHKQKIFLDH